MPQPAKKQKRLVRNKARLRPGTQKVQIAIEWTTKIENADCAKENKRPWSMFSSSVKLHGKIITTGMRDVVKKEKEDRSAREE